VKKSTRDQQRGSSISDQAVRVIIETPKGSRNKFKYDLGSHLFKLDKVLPEGMVFPFDFGFVPCTTCPDGDPLDVLVLMDEPTFPGCYAECRIVGVLKAEQKTKQKKYRNDRLIGVALCSLLYEDLNDLRDLNPSVLKQIEEFFVNYQRARGVTFTILSRQGPKRAFAILRAASSQASRKSDAAT
jgi:inorganic pyrophosphatase